MCENRYRVKIVAPFFDKNTDRYLQIRTFNAWKESIAQVINNFSVGCYYQGNCLVAEAISEDNYKKLLQLHDAHPYMI